jgi:hypothetical protein
MKQNVLLVNNTTEIARSEVLKAVNITREPAGQWHKEAT